MITGTDFLSVPTQDLDAAMAFYGETLELPRSVYVADRNYAEFEAGDLTLSIYMPEKVGLDFAPTRNAVALHVEDIAAARSELEERGVTFEGDTVDTGVCHMAFFSDPDGNALMLHHRYAPRPDRA